MKKISNETAQKAEINSKPNINIGDRVKEPKSLTPAYSEKGVMTWLWNNDGIDDGQVRTVIPIMNTIGNGPMATWDGLRPYWVPIKYLEKYE